MIRDTCVCDESFRIKRMAESPFGTGRPFNATMGAVDPTYPLYPIACIISAALLLLVLMSSVVRQSWNLGVAFLCFWLFFENLTCAINAIIWSDNADIRLYIYCDIGKHVSGYEIQADSDLPSVSSANNHFRRETHVVTLDHA